MVFKYILMEIYMQEVFQKIKNMVKDHFIGLVYVHHLVQYKQNKKFNNIMDNGGEIYQMEKDNI